MKNVVFLGILTRKNPTNLCPRYDPPSTFDIFIYTCLIHWDKVQYMFLNSRSIDPNFVRSFRQCLLKEMGWMVDILFKRFNVIFKFLKQNLGGMRPLIAYYISPSIKATFSM